mgnify:CR=1 FL=1
MMVHKSGFVNIIGNPNVGKSTLMNALVGEKLSIITPKAQTTRHRILGIVNHDDYQIVLSDTPGILKPAYELQSSMMDFVKCGNQITGHSQMVKRKNVHKKLTVHLCGFSPVCLRMCTTSIYCALNGFSCLKI